MSTTISDASLSNFWMPFTANRQFKRAPRMFRSAKGMYYITDDNRRVLDATAGLWCVNAGHGRPEIIEAVAAQIRTMDYAPTFQMGHELAFEAAARIADFMPGTLDRIFFTNSGSESVDTALKMALGFRAINEDTDGDFRLDPLGPLAGLLPGIERPVDRFVSALADFGAPVGATLADVCHPETPCERLGSLGLDSPFRQISGKGYVLDIAGPSLGEKKALTLSRKCLIPFGTHPIG